MTLYSSLRDVSEANRPFGVWAGIILIEAYLVIAYFVFTPAEPTRAIRYLVYPFIWINTGLWTVARMSRPVSQRHHRVLAAVAAIVYFLVIMWIPGNIGIGSAASPHVRVAMLAPGWGPLIAFNSPWIRVFLVPFEVIGYSALTVLLYGNLLAATRGVLSGVFGFVTCIGCTVPVIVPVIGILGGSATSLTATAYAWSYDLGTGFFLLTLGLLYWGRRRESA